MRSKDIPKTLNQRVLQIPARFDFVQSVAKGYFKKGFRALEIGANDGTFAAMFKELGYYTHAYDIKNFKLGKMVDKYTVDPKGFGKYKCPGTYEFIHIGQVLEHVEDPRAILVNAVSAATGLVIVSVPNFPSKDHKRVYSEGYIVHEVSRYLWVAYCETIDLPARKTNMEKKQFIVVAHKQPSKEVVPFESEKK